MGGEEKVTEGGREEGDGGEPRRREENEEFERWMGETKGRGVDG